MDALFHIGMAKTGSTALQTALYGSADHLASRGVLYPHDPDRPRAVNHRLFATQAAPVSRLPWHMAGFGGPREAAARFAAFQTHVLRDIEVLRPDLLVFSAETMFTRIHASHRQRLLRAFRGFGVRAPVFVAYVRRPSERYVSALQQALRRSVEVRQPRRRNWRGPVTDYEALFGKGCVRLHLFHRSALRDGDIVADFCARHLAPHGVETDRLRRAGEANVSVSAESMGILRDFRVEFHSGGDTRRIASVDALREALRAADAACGAARPRLCAEVAEMADYVSDEPLWLRDRHCVEFPGFDYRRLEEGRFAALPARPLALEEIVESDPETRLKVLAHLAGSGWAIWSSRGGDGSRSCADGRGAEKGVSGVSHLGVGAYEFALGRDAEPDVFRGVSRGTGCGLSGDFQRNAWSVSSLNAPKRKSWNAGLPPLRLVRAMEFAEARQSSDSSGAAPSRVISKSVAAK